MSQSDVDITIVTVETTEDRRRWIEVQQATSPCAPYGPDIVAHWWEHAKAGCSALACRGENVVGILRVERSGWAPESRNADVWLMVPAGERRRGVGTALAGVAARWAGDHDLEGLQVITNEAAADAVEFWTHRGFVEVGRDQQSRLELDLPPAAVQAPSGVDLVTLAERPDLVEGMYEVAVEAFADVPGADVYSAGDLEHWRTGDLDVPGMLPDCTVIARAGEQVVGYALLLRDEVRPRVATHEMTAVLRAWRGRGLARAMKVHQLRLAFATGLRVFETENEARNGPMLAVNARLGYRPLPAEVTLRGTWPSELQAD